jgi:hypothetical protein
MTVGANHPGSMQTLLLKSAISEYRTFAMHSFASLREIRMPHLTTDDGVKLYYEEVGAGAPIVFVHEFAGDCSSWEHQLR